PRLFTGLYAAFRTGNRAEAQRLQGLIADLSATVGLHTFPGVIKEAMALSGLSGGVCRRPIGPMPAAARQQLAAAIDALRQQGYTHEPARRRTESLPTATRA
ncbi:MAG: dihydrodipicolinate synthase family protein, partial [Acidobacteria bacterium]|nr:dihydrodipicolinate synthase family protein [Acidobacteriota bacterium]